MDEGTFFTDTGNINDTPDATDWESVTGEDPSTLSDTNVIITSFTPEEYTEGVSVDPELSLNDINSSGTGIGGYAGNNDGAASVPTVETPFSLTPGGGASTGSAPVVDPEGIDIPPLPGSLNPEFMDDLPEEGESGCVTEQRILSMYTWVTINLPPNEAEPADSVETGTGSSSSGVSSGSTSNATSVTADSASSVYINDGEYMVIYDSVHMSLANYSEFVSYGGGIVTNMGLYPYGKIVGGTSIVFNDLNISTEGSTMTILQESEFDAEQILEKGDKVWGYIINEDGDTDPVFIGYVSNITKSLTSNKQNVTYQCKDLAGYLTQYYTGALYKYRPPHASSDQTTKSIKYILNDILVKSGITNAVVDIPDTITCPPIEFRYETIKQVLEWFCKYLGNYIYFIDRYGILTIKKTDSGTNIGAYDIPIAGTALTDTDIVRSFDAITNDERSRSKIILTGDYPLVEVNETLIWPLETVVGSAPYITSKGFFESTTVKSPVVTSKYHRYLAIASDKELQSFLLTEQNSGPYIELDKTYALSGSGGSSGNYTVLSDEYIWLPEQVIYSGTPSSNNIILYNPPRKIPNPNYTGSSSLSDEESEDKYKFDLMLLDSSSANQILINTTDKSLLYSRGSVKASAKYVYRDYIPLTETITTAYTGGTEVVKRPEFKKIVGPGINIDDSDLLKAYANKLKEYYKPIYGGRLVLDGLYTNIELLDKVSITGSDLPTAETANLVIFGIQYNISSNTTTLELSNKTFLDAPYFDIVRERNRDANEELVKLGQLENSELYKKI